MGGMKKEINRMPEVLSGENTALEVGTNCIKASMTPLIYPVHYGLLSRNRVSLMALLRHVVVGGLTLVLICAFSVTTAAATVDVQPLNVTLGSSSVVAGGSLSVSWQIRNNGTGAASTSNSQVRITTSNAAGGYGTSSNNVGSAQATGTIGAGATINQSTTVTVPSTPGTYYVWVIADNNSNLVQTNTSNDEAVSAALTVTATAPSISSVSPNSYPALNGNQTMTINGANFQSGATLTFVPPEGGTIASTASKLTFVNANQLSYQFNNLSDTGTWSVTVNNPDGQHSNTFSFTVTATAGFLSFPLSGYTPYNAPITSVFDHSGPRYGADLRVVAYTGEVGDQKDTNEPPVVFSGVPLYSYKKANGSPFIINGNYVGTATTGPSTLNYDGHPGYDYPVPIIGTEVHAAADGTVVCLNETNINDASGFYIQVKHDPSGYLTEYLHLSKVDPSVTNNAAITRGQLIGYSGNTGPVGTGKHLHFEVKTAITSTNCPYAGTSVDPYGWTGNGSDPYVLTYGIANVNLWQVSAPQGPPPTINIVQPTTMPASTALQSLKVFGSNIQPGSAHLIFTDPSGQIYNSSAHPDREVLITATEFDYQINNGATTGTWTVKVLNPDGQQSNALSFQVVTPSPPSGSVVLGLDVSHYQGTIDWAQVRNSGRIFSFVKATGGDITAYDDLNFAQNMANGKAAGLTVGAYHVASPPLADAVAEANHFIAVAGPYIATGYLRPVLDIEPTASGNLGKTAISQWIRDWCNTVETKTGVRPILYMVRYDAINNMDADLNKYPIWIPTNSNDPAADPGSLGAWSSWSFQQYGTDATQSTCSGITGYADLDSFNGDMATFNSNVVIADTIPDAFTFTSQTGVALSQIFTSNAITVTGINSASPISITGGAYSINGGSYTSTSGMVVNGDTVTVQQTSSASYSTMTSATLTIGGVSGTFRVTTLALDTTPDQFNFTAQTGVALNTVITSNTITVSGINATAPISITGGTYAINSGAYTSASGTVNNGDTVTVQLTSSASYSTMTSATLTIGGVSGAFRVTTLNDTTPDAFTFTAQTGVPLSTVITSNTITVSGIDAATTISIVGGTYSINGGSYTSTSGTVSNGNTVTLKQTSSASYSTETDAMLTIGGVSGAFRVTTISDTIPHKFKFTDKKKVGLGQIITSNTITISGLGIGVCAAISITGGEYSINGGAYTSDPGCVKNGDTVTVRLTASDNCSTKEDAILTIGGVSDTFSVTTEPTDTKPDKFIFIPQTSVPLDTVITSNTITVSGINTAAPISIVGGEYSINSGSYTSAPGTVNDGDTVTVRQTSSGNYATTTNAILTIGGVKGTFSVTTRAVSIVFNYDYDTYGFFTTERRALVEQAAATLLARISGTWAQVDPAVTGGSYDLAFINPSTWEVTWSSNVVIPKNQITVYLGAVDFSTLGAPMNSSLGVGCTQLMGIRNVTGNMQKVLTSATQFRPVNASITFDLQGIQGFGGGHTKQWHFDSDGNLATDDRNPADPNHDNYADFSTAIIHELGHILGIHDPAPFAAMGITSDPNFCLAWLSHVQDLGSGNYVFTGANAKKLYYGHVGSNIPLEVGNKCHWKAGVKSGPSGDWTSVTHESDALRPFRVLFSEMEFQALKDIGYKISAP